MSFGFPGWGDNHRIVAQRWGLVVDDGVHIHGVLDRIPVAIMLAAHIGNRGDSSNYDDCVYSAILPTPSPLWFNLAEKTLHEQMGDFFLSLVGKPSGHDGFDKRFEIHATDPARVAAIFDEEARAAVFKLADEHYHPLITTQMVSLRVFRGAFAPPESIDFALRELVATTHTLARTFAIASMGGGYR